MNTATSLQFVPRLGSHSECPPVKFYRSGRRPPAYFSFRTRNLVSSNAVERHSKRHLYDISMQLKQFQCIFYSNIYGLQLHTNKKCVLVGTLMRCPHCDALQGDPTKVPFLRHILTLSLRHSSSVPFSTWTFFEFLHVQCLKWIRKTFEKYFIIRSQGSSIASTARTPPMFGT